MNEKVEEPTREQLVEELTDLRAEYQSLSDGYLREGRENKALRDHITKMEQIGMKAAWEQRDVKIGEVREWLKNVPKP